MFAPAGTPTPIVERLHAEFVRILKLPDVARRLASSAMEIVATPPSEFAAEVRADLARWPTLIKPEDVR